MKYIPIRFTRFAAAVVAAITFLPGSLVWPVVFAAESYIPASDQEVVAQLDPAVVVLARTLRRSDGNFDTSAPEQEAAHLAASEILRAYSLATEQNDARAYGRTLVLIQRWPAGQVLPAGLRLIKADILQRSHEFAAAALELHLVLEADPSSEQALSMLAQINLVTGDYAQARNFCERLAQLSQLYTSLNCHAQVDGLTGKADRALTTLEQALRSPSLPRLTAFELHTTAATIAHRLDKPADAEWHYRQALTLDSGNNYLRLNYADWLLEQGRAAEAASMLAGSSADPDRYEQRLIYLQALAESGEQDLAGRLGAELADQIALLSKRGNDQPYKVIARYALVIEGNAARALENAWLNWEEQKEPSDALLLAQAATAANDHDTLRELRNWYDSIRLEDRRLDSLLSGTAN